MKKRVSKREVELKRQRRGGKIIREKAFRTTGVIYIKPLASRLLRVFQENSESYGEERDVEHEIFEALKCVAIVGEGFENITRHSKTFSPPTLTVVIINDYEEEE